MADIINTKPKRTSNGQYFNRVASALTNEQYQHLLIAADIQGLNVCAFIREALDAYVIAVVEQNGQPINEIS
jgi:hypothetical protein